VRELETLILLGVKMDGDLWSQLSAARMCLWHVVYIYNRSFCNSAVLIAPLNAFLPTILSYMTS
jgi:hypothetical protein